MCVRPRSASIQVCTYTVQPALPPPPPTAALTRVCIPESALQRPRKASPVRPQPVEVE